jgi:hypothetical protein
LWWGIKKLFFTNIEVRNGTLIISPYASRKYWDERNKATTKESEGKQESSQPNMLQGKQKESCPIMTKRQGELISGTIDWNEVVEKVPGQTQK